MGRRRRQTDRRERLATDVARLTGWAEALVAEAERVGSPVPPVVRFAVAVWRAWADLLGENAPLDR